MTMEEFSGLCVSCKNAPKCDYLKIAKKPVLQCSEFQGFESRPMKKAPDLKPKKPEEADDASKFMGLCRTCEIRKTCKYPKPEGGVWHCDEYE